MKQWCLGFAIVIGVCTSSGCANSRGPNTGSSETHFLVRCSDENCGAGLHCICGACSTACTAEASCDELSSGATCMEPEDAACEQSRSCDVECTLNSDCAELGADHKCEDGRCRAIDRSYVDTTPPGMPTGDPGFGYGLCANNSPCAGSGVAEGSSDGGCICVAFCETNADCPRSDTGSALATCMHSDLIINGHSGTCDLPCNHGERCPDGAACNGAVCRFSADADAGAP